MSGYEGVCTHQSASSVIVYPPDASSTYLGRFQVLQDAISVPQPRKWVEKLTVVAYDLALLVHDDHEQLKGG